MKYYKQETGVRPWHGDEMIGLQKETLDLIAALASQVSSNSAMIISGCEVTPSGSNVDISPGHLGFVDGSNYVIATFDGLTSVLPTVHLGLQKTNTNKPYLNGQNKLAVTEYKAVQATAGPSTLSMENPARLTQMLVQDQAITGAINFDNSGQLQPPYQISGTINYRITPATGMVTIYGTFSIGQFSSNDNTHQGAGRFLTINNVSDIILPEYPVILDCVITSQINSIGAVEYSTPQLTPSSAILRSIPLKIENSNGVTKLSANVISPNNYTSYSGIFDATYMLNI